MSDTPQGEGWWLASDGKWHPPEYDPSEAARPGAGGAFSAHEERTDRPWSPTGGTGGHEAVREPPGFGDPEPADSSFSEPLFGHSGAGSRNGAPAAHEAAPSNGTGSPTARPGEFGLPSAPSPSTQTQTVRPAGAPKPKGADPDKKPGLHPAVYWGITAGAVVLVLVGGWFLFLKDSDDGQADDAQVEPTVASETTVSGEDTPEATEPLPPKPTIAPGEHLPELSFTGEGDSTVNVDPPGPRVARIDYTGTGPFSVTGLDANGEEVAVFAEAEGPYTGAVAVDFRDEQDSRSLRIDADGAWSIEMVPVETLDATEAAFEGSGDDVVLYAGDVGPVAVAHSGTGPIAVNYFEIRTRDITTLLEDSGTIDESVELRGPAFVWVEAEGDWSITPG